VSDDPRTYDYSSPSRTCDVVMKGGITSGVVYPHAVCELARVYRLRNVGGTSAGAIAAAAAGAAELGRTSASGGFKRLAGLPDWISTDNHLFKLFQPQRGTKRLYRLVTAGLGGGVKGKFRVFVAAVRSFPLTALAGVALGVLGIVVAARSHGLTLVVGVVCGALLTLLGLVLALLARTVLALGRALPRNRFGLCSGFGTDANNPALTPWLTGLLNELADKSSGTGPLTFGDMENGGVNLKFMTSNLILRRPYSMPWDSREFFFHPGEFREFFPEEVVAWMESHPPAPQGSDSEQREWKLRCRLLAPLRPFPSPADLPVIVATRMSLSFPILLSAVPLWSVDMSLTANQDATKKWNHWLGEHQADWEQLVDGAGVDLPKRPVAERCWFSDGGISSNFPLHFFDSPLPAHPTFAINLRPFHPDHPESTDEEENVYLPATSGGGLLEWWYRFPTKQGLAQVFSFVGAIVRTMQNRVDEAQMRVPGYRDRVAHVSLSPKEGGLNLDMPPSVLGRLTTRGLFAGRKLIRRFAEPPADPRDLSWDSHRWTRYRSTLTALAEFVQRFQLVYTSAPEVPGDRTYTQLSARGANDPPAAYRWKSAPQRQLGETFTERIDDAAQTTAGQPDLLADGSPQPKPEARVVPRS
jgi:Patatin-like phospholipase